MFDTTPPRRAPPPVGASNTPTPLRHKFPQVRPPLGPGGGLGEDRIFFSWEEFRAWKPPHRRAGVGSAFDAPPPHRLRRTRPAPGPHQVFSEVARLQCDSLDLTLGLTDFAGQKPVKSVGQSPVSEITGHCFVVGARHQLRASMSAGWRGSAGQVRRNFRQLSPHWNFFSQLSPHRTTGFFSQLSA